MYRDNFKEEQEDIKLLVSRYEEMLTNEGIGFFEKKQFTQLINYSLGPLKLFITLKKPSSAKFHASIS